jgi:hypothetical protein
VRPRGVIRGLILAWACCTAAPAAGFAGRDSTHAAFAKAQGIGLAPTAELLEVEGNAAAGALLGLLTPEFRGLYRERAIEDGRSRFRGNRTLFPAN